MGLSSAASQEMSPAHYRTHKIFLLSNYLLLGAASSCIFLTLSLRLIPSAVGFLLILLHSLTIAGAVSGCAVANSSARKWHGAHMVATVLTAILQGSVALLVFTRTAEFLLGGLRSYVRVEDGVIILRMDLSPPRRNSAVLVNTSKATEPCKMAVSTVATMWAPCHFRAEEFATAQPETAPAMVSEWRRMRRNPTAEGMRRRERVRKMQLEAAPRRR
ncbi:hypothetical protein HPP92_009180 [Vanilla planifolia]|uniref:Uncharacterized protein n=1 Tax=Vanilla planifolia TaxID=51239 RepID=A0A835R9I3_VANPL|nr:hypothetical protein HPP92_009180 [Vanilla planifolia]